MTEPINITQHRPGLPRPESMMSGTGLVWDSETGTWRDEEDGGSQSTAADPAAAAVVTTDPEKLAGQQASLEPIWLEFEPGDRTNPFNWSKRKKWTTTWISCIFTLIVAFAGSAFAMGNDSMIRDLNCEPILATLALSVFPLGFGLGPLVMAPFSEAYGRYPMYVGSAFVYMVFFLPITLGHNIASVIVGRLIGGIAASTGSTLVGGTIADIFEAKDRGLPMSIFSLCAFGGTGLGPGVMGYVEEFLGWRWISWIQMMMAGVMFIAIVFLTRETRGSVLLSKRAAKLRKETGDERYQCRSDAERASLAILIRVSLTRPIYLLCTEAVVASFSLYVAFAWGFMYLTLRAVPLVFTSDYGFSIGEVGLVFFTIVVGGLLGYLSNIYQERLYQRHVAKRGPEARLYAAMVGGIMFPFGVFIFAFASGRGHWMGPVVGLVMVFLGVFTIYLATFNYLADCYTIYASSALSGQSLCRNLFGFAFPLFTTPMYEGMGYQWASFLAGCLALTLSATPFVLMAYGPKIRAKSLFAKELERIRAGSGK